jgi:hypothetical protein
MVVGGFDSAQVAAVVLVLRTLQMLRVIARYMSEGLALSLASSLISQRTSGAFLHIVSVAASYTPQLLADKN